MNAKPVILVVDDQTQNNDLLEALLVPKGYEISKAASGAEALKILAGNQIDLVLLDVMMPGMDGFEVIRRVRQDETKRQLPIILVTALWEKEDRVKGIEAGCDDFISKPVDKMELLARVQSLLKVKAYNDLMINYQKELEAKVTERTEDLKHAFEHIKAASLDTIYRLSTASEYKDEDTGAHIKRMSRYSAAVARRLGLNENTIETILYASPMHDLGKIGIPDRILLKPAKHDAVEWEIMKLHTVIGSKILAGSDAEFIKLGEIIAQSHHEKWDGSGYPDSLKGDEIPLAGRITAIADVFDALTSKRPYKEPFSVEKSLTIIRQGRGSHFDPAVVDAFLAIQDEILSIKERFTEVKHQSFDIPELKSLLAQYSASEVYIQNDAAAVKLKQSELLKSSELRYRRLFEAAREGILILDAETGLILDVNPFLTDLLGYSKEDILSKKLWEIGFIKDVMTNKRSFLELQQKQYIRYEDLPLESKNGKLVNVEFVSTVYEVDNKKVILCNIRDISDRKIVEESLAQAARRDSVISELASKLVSSISISDIAELVLESAERFTSSTFGFVGYISPESGYMISPAMVNGTWEFPPAKDDNGIFKKYSGDWGEALNNRQSLLTNTPQDELLLSKTQASSKRINNLVLVPALIGSELVGQIVLANSTRDYSQSDLELVERLATLYAIAIKHQRTEDKVRKMAYNDPLTGLPNRILFNDRYTIALAGARRFHKKIGVMVLDIDNFKHVNDTLGHAAGDEVLKDFSNTLLSVLRKTDTVVRLGGDEFVIMVTDVINSDYLAIVARKVIEAAHRPIRYLNHEFRITVSIGISCYPEDGEDIEALLKYADVAMYRVKQNGRDNYLRYTAGMDTQDTTHLGKTTER